MLQSITDTTDFKYSIHCLNCAYSDLGYNGSKECLPRTKSCKPIYPYDLAIKSKLRAESIAYGL